MGREQGDHLGEAETVWYVGTVRGVEHERPASTPAEHINLKARGWVTKESLGRPNGPETTSASSGSSQGSTETPTTGEQPNFSASTDEPGSSTTDPSPEGGPAAPARRGGKRAPDVQSAAPQDEAAAAAGEAG